MIGAHGLYENKNKKGTHQHAQLLHFTSLKLRVLESAKMGLKPVFQQSFRFHWTLDPHLKMALNHGDPRSLIIMFVAQNSMQQITMHAHISYNTSSTNWKQTKIVTCEGIEPFRLSTTTQVSYKTRLFKYKTTLSHNIISILETKGCYK